MTYNVLAQCYVRSSFFPYCNGSALRWKNRSRKLVR
jgi:CCR4-NOT transcription complex subunit 6